MSPKNPYLVKIASADLSKLKPEQELTLNALLAFVWEVRQLRSEMSKDPVLLFDPSDLMGEDEDAPRGIEGGY